MNETVEINVEEYIKLRNTINMLQSENHRLQAIVDAIAVVFKNSGMMK